MFVLKNDLQLVFEMQKNDYSQKDIDRTEVR